MVMSSCEHVSVQVLDAESLFAPTLPVRSVCVEDVVWQKDAGEGDGSSPKIHLNATLRWSYPPQLVRHWRVHWQRLRGPDPRVPPGPMALIGRSYSTMYRVVDLEVPDPPGLLELLVEPISREGFSLNQSYWGRISLSYTHATDI